jgi:3-oxoacyl-[acyl-carrier-protein] synthase-3
MHSAAILGLASYLPGRPVPVEELFDGADPPLVRSPLLRPPRFRRHIARERPAASLIEQAARALLADVDHGPQIDVVLTNVLLPDTPITGVGAETAARLDLVPTTILDVHNGGCGSFPFMLDLAERLLDRRADCAALICNVQNTAGKVFSQPNVRLRRHAVAAGDGCAVALVQIGAGSSVLATAVLHDPASAADMGLSLAERLYWEPGEEEIDIHFEPQHMEDIVRRGNAAVPRVVRAACERAAVAPEDLDVLITNQPNRLFLRNWREALDIPADRHPDTFDVFGNLYGAAAPVTLTHAATTGRLREGDLVAIAGFAHAGDFAAASVLRWSASTRAVEASAQTTEAVAG